MKDKDFVLLAVNQMESPDHVFAYTGQLEIQATFSILFDSTSKVSQAYQLQGLPSTYLIDKKSIFATARLVVANLTTPMLNNRL